MREKTRKIGKFIVFVPVVLFVILFLASVLVRFLRPEAQGIPLGDPLITILSMLLLLSFVVAIVIIPIGAVLWWKRK